MKAIRKWLIFLIMARMKLKIAYIELNRVEKEWELQYRPYSFIITCVRFAIVVAVGALVCLVGLMGLALL